ncbi:hypothetical protein BDA99DRAFT_478203 [Phascolomyces articulosus]|uniref:Uncharacterized protein n=1 Tax=Phascolomyces articulosus TaxID=60185 RepID=A0AAD5KG55_9FUNG|nr:hypothetical protein BDA99DRAFT_478203 [Phascolomyces articulosus]
MLLRIFAIIFIDIGLPIALFFIVNRFSTPWIALIVAGIPSVLRIIYTFIRHRRIDFLNVIFLIAFGVSTAVSVVSGDIRVLLLREAIITGLMAFIFLITLIPLKTRKFEVVPLTHLSAREIMQVLPNQIWTDEAGVKHNLPLAEWMWREMCLCRVLNRLLTLFWGLCFLAECTTRIVLVYTGVSVEQVMTVGVIIAATLLSLAGIISMFMFIYLRRKCIRYRQEWRKTHDFSDHFPVDQEDTLN